MSRVAGPDAVGQIRRLVDTRTAATIAAARTCNYSVTFQCLSSSSSMQCDYIRTTSVSQSNQANNLSVVTAFHNYNQTIVCSTLLSAVEVVLSSLINLLGLHKNFLELIFYCHNLGLYPVINIVITNESDDGHVISKPTSKGWNGRPSGTSGSGALVNGTGD